MSRLPLVFAVALALPSVASATDLMQTYEMARNGDPTLAQAEADRLSQKEGVVQARATLLPQISGTASLGRSSGRVMSPKNKKSDWAEQSRTRNYGVTLTQKLVDFSAYSTVKEQKALSQSADFDLDTAKNSLITRTSEAYFNVLVAIETLAADEAAETAYKRQYDYAQKRLDVGLAPITDVYTAKASYDSARASVISQRNTLKDAYQALVEITGQPVLNLRGLPDDFKPQLPTKLDLQGWVDTALAQSPSLKSLQLQAQSAQAAVASARGGHLPTLSLSGSYTRDATWGGPSTTVPNPDGSSTTSSRGINDGRSIALSLDVPIFSGGSVQSQVRQAIAQRDAAQDAYEQERRAVIRDTRNAYQVLEAGISEIEAYRSAVDSARKAYEASQVGLEVGTKTILDVLTNQENLVSAQQSYAQAKYNFLQNRLLLESYAGTLNVSNLQDINALLSADGNAHLSRSDLEALGTPTAR